MKSLPPPKTVNERVQERSIYIKAEGAIKGIYPVRTNREQIPGPEELSYTELVAKMIELSEYIKEKHYVHQAIKNTMRVDRVLYSRSQEDQKNYKE